MNKSTTNLAPALNGWSNNLNTIPNKYKDGNTFIFLYIHDEIHKAFWDTKEKLWKVHEPWFIVFPQNAITFWRPMIPGPYEYGDAGTSNQELDRLLEFDI